MLGKVYITSNTSEWLEVLQLDVCRNIMRRKLANKRVIVVVVTVAGA
jgi:hypothetical protein